ncbi:hypothetical protein [Croceicoccus sp. BE223]|uniref:hypothetical protein n=1 Tax=Croceicoccus sp. BE223 TaxID=2817716 RepID=UPI0028612FE3|nr:hypothetical protein [Croceicoccus sp. BE223]MDR7101433.1 hypothetical protein [Croceicoccus sp. BE223]
MIDEQTLAAITATDEDRAALFLARGHADFPELAGLFASHREAATTPIGADLAGDAAQVIESLIDHLGVSDHLIEVNGRCLTASGILNRLAAPQANCPECSKILAICDCHPF